MNPNVKQMLDTLKPDEVTGLLNHLRWKEAREARIYIWTYGDLLVSYLKLANQRDAALQVELIVDKAMESL